MIQIELMRLIGGLLLVLSGLLLVGDYMLVAAINVIFGCVLIDASLTRHDPPGV